MHRLGLSMPDSWLATTTIAVAWLGLMLVYSPVADRIATRWFKRPPELGAFRALQQSRIKLLSGIVVAWMLGGFLEEWALRGLVLRLLRAFLLPWFAEPISTGIALCTAALIAGLVHLYQGPRAAVIITQLSALFGLLYVLSGYNLWAVVLCHGMYDTIAFVRFAAKSSKYARLEAGPV